MAISDTITSMYENVGNVYDVLELAGADLTNVDKNIQNLKQSWEERLLYFLANGTDVVWNNWLPKVTGSGETITLNNTIEAKMDFVYKGNTYQYSTTGKNLCYFSNFTEGGVNFNGSEINVGNPTGSVVYAGSNFNLQDDTSKSGKTYTIYACVNGTKQTGSSGTGLSINFAKTGTPIAFQVNLASSEGSFNNHIYIGTITLGENEVFRNVSVVTNNAITANINVKVMVVEGSYTEQTIGDFEPYTNGASPNPDYPQPIQVVSGDNTIKDEGKNLFDKATITDNKYLDINGVKQNDNTKCYSDYIAINSNNNYITNQMGNWGGVCTCYYDTNKTFISAETGTTIVGNNNIFTIPSNAYYMRVSTNKSWIDITQIELGSTTTTYEPYQSQTHPISLGNIELCKIGDYQDRIYKDSGKWYLNKQIGKVVLDGSENWTYQDQYHRFMFSSYTGDKLKTNTCNYISHYIKGQTANANNTLNVWAIESSKQVLVHDERFTTKEQFNAWLVNNNVIIYGQLYTPTYEEITDTTLISQLEALKKSYNNQTNISQENSKEAFILDVTALGN